MATRVGSGMRRRRTGRCGIGRGSGGSAGVEETGSIEEEPWPGGEAAAGGDWGGISRG